MLGGKLIKATITTIIKHKTTMAKKKAKQEITTTITARFIEPDSNSDKMKVELDLQRGVKGEHKMMEQYVGNLRKVKRKKK